MLGVIAPRRSPQQDKQYRVLLFGHREFARWRPLIDSDIRDASALDAVLISVSFDAVMMHFAPLAYAGESVTAPGRYYDVNVNGTWTLLDARPEVMVFGTDYPTLDGTAVRNYVHVDDLARAHV